MSEISLPRSDSDLLATIRPPRRGVLVVCLLMAGIVHLALLSHLRIASSPAREQRTLQVRLVQPTVRPIVQPIVQQIVQPPVEQAATLEREELPIPLMERVPLPTLAEPVAAIDAAAPEDLPDNSVEPDAEPLTPSGRASGFQLYQQALDAVSEVSVPQAVVAPRSFGTSDFPSDKVASDPYARPAPIRQFVTRARKVVEHDRQGNVMVRRVDEFGNVTCMQRRGFEGDGNPPLWYPIIGDACFVPGGND